MFLHSLKSLLQNQVTEYPWLLRSPQDLPCRRKSVWLGEFSTNQRCLLPLSALPAAASPRCTSGFTPAPVGSESNPTGQLLPSKFFSLLCRNNLEFSSLHFPGITSVLTHSLTHLLPTYWRPSSWSWLLILNATAAQAWLSLSVCACPQLLYFLRLTPPTRHLLSARCLLVPEVGAAPSPRAAHPLQQLLTPIWKQIYAYALRPPWRSCQLRSTPRFSFALQRKERRQELLPQQRTGILGRTGWTALKDTVISTERDPVIQNA